MTLCFCMNSIGIGAVGAFEAATHWKWLPEKWLGSHKYRFMIVYAVYSVRRISEMGFSTNNIRHLCMNNFNQLSVHCIPTTIPKQNSNNKIYTNDNKQQPQQQQQKQSLRWCTTYIYIYMKLYVYISVCVHMDTGFPSEWIKTADCMRNSAQPKHHINIHVQRIRARVRARALYFSLLLSLQIRWRYWAHGAHTTIKHSIHKNDTGKKKTHTLSHRHRAHTNLSYIFIFIYIVNTWTNEIGWIRAHKKKTADIYCA